MNKSRMLTINGVTKHLKEWAQIHNIPFSVVESRWDKGVRDILTLLSPKKESIKITYKGKTATLKQWSNITGIKYDTIHARYRKKIDLDKVLSPWSKRSNIETNERETVKETSIRRNRI